MAWPYTVAHTFSKGEEPTKFDNQPMDANTAILEGCPAGLNAASTPNKCIRPLQTGDTFAGFAERSSDNTTATAANPNILQGGSFGDGTTGPNGAKVRLRVEGLIEFGADVPDGTGTINGLITGLAGTQADVNTQIYYNGSGYTTSSGGSAVSVGYVQYVKLSFPSGSTIWGIRFKSAAVHNT